MKRSKFTLRQTGFDQVDQPGDLRPGRDAAGQRDQLVEALDLVLREEQGQMVGQRHFPLGSLVERLGLVGNLRRFLRDLGRQHRAPPLIFARRAHVAGRKTHLDARAMFDDSSRRTA